MAKAAAKRTHEDALRQAEEHLEGLRDRLKWLAERSGVLTTEIAEAYSEGADAARDPAALKEERAKVERERADVASELEIMRDAVEKARLKVGRGKIAEEVEQYEALAEDVAKLGTQMEDTLRRLADLWEIYDGKAVEVETVRKRISNLSERYGTDDKAPPHVAHVTGLDSSLLSHVSKTRGKLEILDSARQREREGPAKAPEPSPPSHAAMNHLRQFAPDRYARLRKEWAGRA